MSSLFTVPRFTKKWYGDSSEQMAAYERPSYSTLPVGEMVVNWVSSTLGDTMLFCSTSLLRSSTAVSTLTSGGVVEQPAATADANFRLNLALAAACASARAVPDGSFPRIFTCLLS